MDESPEELERIRHAAAQIDPHQYKRRRHAVYAMLLGAFGAGLVWLVLEMSDQGRNPCARMKDHLCKDPGSNQCKTFVDLVYGDSVDNPSADLRQQMRAQCLRKIERLKEEEGITVP